MTEGNFVDYTKVTVESGRGGKGSTHLHREKYVEKGGPDGGDGGRGGHIILKGNKNLWTLYHFKYKRHFKAAQGGNGAKQRRSGEDGEDIVVELPLGTVIKDTETGQIVHEILEDGAEYIICEGGKGGRGNWHFKSSTRQTPRYAQTGMDSNALDVTFELKILADVGLV